MRFRGVVTVGAAALIAATAVRAQEAVDPRVAAYDRGPATVDVATYPADMQAKYKVFLARCSKCHTAARAINSDFVLEDEWERYIKRMMRKPGSGISSGDARQIFEFLSYDSKIRKKALYDRKLKEAGKSGA